ncbi:MAG: hypothetical protein FJX60_15650 [Alphaproteobacteria bacterium]|nr:hypothetical protein [Alphaproteobacteria bacterium]
MTLELRSGLARIQGAAPAPSEEIGLLRRRAFVERGVAMIELSDVVDPWTKQAVINEARRQLERKAEVTVPAPAAPAPATAPRRRPRR